MTRMYKPLRIAALAAGACLLLSAAASAQDRGGNFIDNLFSRGEAPAAPADSQVEYRRNDQGNSGQGGRVAQADPGDVAVRLDSMENAIRQLTGTIEQLQYRNQQLE